MAREYPKGGKADWQKMYKSEADYREGTPEEHCGVCSMFRPPASCTLVEGKIKPTGVCDYFKKK